MRWCYENMHFFWTQPTNLIVQTMQFWLVVIVCSFPWMWHSLYCLERVSQAPYYTLESPTARVITFFMAAEAQVPNVLSSWASFTHTAGCVAAPSNIATGV